MLPDCQADLTGNETARRQNATHYICYLIAVGIFMSPPYTILVSIQRQNPKVSPNTTERANG